MTGDSTSEFVRKVNQNFQRMIQDKLKTITSLQGIKNINIVEGSITNTEIANEAVTTSKIADGAVTTAKICDHAVTTEKLSSTLQNLINTDYPIIFNTSTPSGSHADGTIWIQYVAN